MKPTTPVRDPGAKAKAAPKQSATKAKAAAKKTAKETGKRMSLGQQLVAKARNVFRKSLEAQHLKDARRPPELVNGALTRGATNPPPVPVSASAPAPAAHAPDTTAEPPTGAASSSNAETAAARADRLLAAKAALPAHQVHHRASAHGVGAAARAASQRAAKVARRLSRQQERPSTRQKTAPSTESAEGEEGEEPWRPLMGVQLPPRDPKENYEISEKDENSDAEEPDRTGKYIPSWSQTYLQKLKDQADIDPDTIFGCCVPAVNLDVIFEDEDYRRVRKGRPVKKRGSSGNWTRDRLSRAEVDAYKSKMRQTRQVEVGANLR